MRLAGRAAPVPGAAVQLLRHDHLGRRQHRQVPARLAEPAELADRVRPEAQLRGDGEARHGPVESVQRPARQVRRRQPGAGVSLAVGHSPVTLTAVEARGLAPPDHEPGADRKCAADPGPRQSVACGRREAGAVAAGGRHAPLASPVYVARHRTQQQPLVRLRAG